MVITHHPRLRRPGQNRWLVWYCRPDLFVVIRAGKDLRAFKTSASASAFVKRCELLAARMWANRWGKMFAPMAGAS